MPCGYICACSPKISRRSDKLIELGCTRHLHAEALRRGGVYMSAVGRDARSAAGSKLACAALVHMQEGSQKESRWQPGGRTTAPTRPRRRAQDVTCLTGDADETARSRPNRRRTCSLCALASSFCCKKRMAAEPPPLGALPLTHVLMTTNYRPWMAYVLAERNPSLAVVVVAPDGLAPRGASLPNLHFEALENHAALGLRFARTYFPATLIDEDWDSFTVLRWLVSAAVLRKRLGSAGLRHAAVALIEADVLVFESVADRFRLLQQQSPGLLGAWPFRAGYFIASAELLQRFASWAEQLYAGPRDALLRTIQRHGYRVRLDTARRRAHARSVGAALHRGNESVQLFNDMALIDAFRQSARGETVAGAPPAPRGRIAVNTVRPDCVGVINPHTFARSSEYSSLRWVGRTPHVRRPACGAGVDVDWCPLCFIHFQGRAKETLNASEWVRRATARTAGALS